MAQAELKSTVQDDDLDGVVDAAILTAGGDMRAAILGLIRGQHQTEAEALATTSAGYGTVATHASLHSSYSASALSPIGPPPSFGRREPRPRLET
jgi:hypothetical protein